MKKVRLTTKEKAFTEELIKNPREEPRLAVVKAGYNVGSMANASKMASELLRKPHIQSKLQNYTDLVENAMINTVAEWQDADQPRKREIALQNAQYIHDKVHGKARQTMDIQSTKVTIAISLNSVAEPEDTQTA